MHLKDRRVPMGDGSVACAAFIAASVDADHDVGDITASPSLPTASLRSSTAASVIDAVMTMVANLGVRWRRSLRCPGLLQDVARAHFVSLPRR
jgi:hypothetical protein